MRWEVGREAWTAGRERGKDRTSVEEGREGVKKRKKGDRK